MAVHVSETVIAALVAEGQLGVLDPQQVQQGRVQIVDVNRVFDDVEAELVGRPESDPRLDPAARHPHRESLRVVVASEAASERGAGLDHGRPSEFATPDHKRVLEESALLQIHHQGGGGLVDLESLGLDAVLNLRVVIPS